MSMRADLQDNRKKIAEHSLVEYVAWTSHKHGFAPSRDFVANLCKRFGVDGVDPDDIIRRSKDVDATSFERRHCPRTPIRQSKTNDAIIPMAFVIIGIVVYILMMISKALRGG